MIPARSPTQRARILRATRLGGRAPARRGFDRALRSLRRGPPPLLSALVLALALLVTLAGYLSAPYRAVRELQASVRERNQPAIAAALDLQSVSESLQDQVDELLTQAVAEAPRPGSAQAVFGRVGPTVARGLAGPLIQRVFSSAGMTEFLARNGAPARELVRIANGPPRGPAVNTRPRPPAVEDWLEPTESMRFHTPTRFAVQLSSGWVLLLRPYGLRWKVYDVRVPGDLFRS